MDEHLILPFKKIKLMHGLQPDSLCSSNKTKDLDFKTNNNFNPIKKYIVNSQLKQSYNSHLNRSPNGYFSYCPNKYQYIKIRPTELMTNTYSKQDTITNNNPINVVNNISLNVNNTLETNNNNIKLIPQTTDRVEITRLVDSIPLTYCPDTSVSVINLSNVTLAADEINLLNKGLSFIPTQKYIKLSVLKENLNKLIRSIKIHSYINNLTPQNTERNNTRTNNYLDLTHSSNSPNNIEQINNSNDHNNYTKINTQYLKPFSRHFTNTSNWVPPDSILPEQTLLLIDNIKFNFSNIIDEHIKFTKKFYNFKIQIYKEDNLKETERLAIKNLRNIKDIIVKPVDKGSNICIMNKTDYIYEATTQLSDSKYYKRISEPIYPSNIPRIREILYRLKMKNYITPKQFDYLSGPEEPGPRIFYLLPKTHKDPKDWRIPYRIPKGRPIVSDSASESSRIAEYIDFFLNPLSQKHNSYIKNTYDFVNKIKMIRVPHNCFLVTGDIESLYTNMDLNRCLKIVQDTFSKNPDPNRPDNEILQLLEISLKCNDFNFNNDFYLQILGCAMGKRFAPALANLYLLEFDNAASQFKNLLCFFRYLDDIFTVFIGSEEDLINYQNFINKILPNIKVTLQYSKLEVNFLDTTIFIKDNTLQTRVYFKLTDTHQLLHHNSDHPKHTFKGLLKSQLIRFKRLCSAKHDYNMACKILFKSLLGRGYSLRTMTTLQHTIWWQYELKSEQQKSLNSKHSKKRKNYKNNIKKFNTKGILPIITNNDQLSIKLSRAYSKLITNSNLFPHLSIITAYTTNNNLRKTLVHSKLV